MSITKKSLIFALLLGFFAGSLTLANLHSVEVKTLWNKGDFAKLPKTGQYVVLFGLQDHEDMAKQMEVLLSAQKTLWERRLNQFKSENKELYDKEPDKAKSMEPQKPFEIYETLYSSETRLFFDEHKVKKIPSLVVFENGNRKQLMSGLQEAKAVIAAIETKVYVAVLTDAGFEDAVKEGYVFVDFWAPWCGPCIKIAPHVKALAQELAGKVTFYKLNTDNNKISAKKYVGRGIPTLVLFKDGKPIETLVGYRPLERLRKEVLAKISLETEPAEAKEGN